jgi:2,4-dienoyl-CoA reductase-like NADH-dependent reductase (Old Yellow Enzyme family)
MTKLYRVKDTAAIFERFKKAGAYINSLGAIIQNEEVIVSEDDIAAWEKKINAAIKALEGLKQATTEQIRKNPKIEEIVEDPNADIVGDPF